MDKRWNSMNFGGVHVNTSPPFDPKFFQEPHRHIKLLRKVSRAGRADSEKIALENEGVAKVVWGQPEDFDGHMEMVGTTSVSEQERELHRADPKDSPSVVRTNEVDQELLTENQNMAHLEENGVATGDDLPRNETESIGNEDIRISDLNSSNTIGSNVSFSPSEALNLTLREMISNNPPIHIQPSEPIQNEGPPVENIPVEEEERRTGPSRDTSTSESTSEPESASIPFKG
jgi:hypothetical protein